MEKESGIVYLTWTSIFHEMLDDGVEDKYIARLLIARDYLVMGHEEKAKDVIKDIPNYLKRELEWIKPIAKSNNQKYLNGCKGGRPVDYKTNITKMIKKMHEDYHDEELVTVLCSWFEHLNKNKKPTKIDNLKETFEEISRQTTSAAGAIRIIKRNLEIGNLELDFDIMHNQDYVRLDDSE